MSETKTFEELFLSSNLSHNLSISNLKILLISDINSNYMYVEKLKEWQLENNQYFDYIFFCGNFLSFNQEVNEQKNLPKAEADISGLITYIENIQLNVFYVPGYNDPKTLLKEESPTITVKSKNIHKKFVKLADDLYVIGVSGNVAKLIDNIPDGYFYIQGNIIKKDNQSEYSLFAFNDKKFNNDLKETIEAFKKEISENNSTPNIKFILLTNIGPSHSPTTFLINEKEHNMCSSGSKRLQSDIAENSKEILVNVHGGSPNNKGVSVIKDTMIVNPGELEKGNFAILEMERDPLINYSWKIKKIELKELI